MTIKVANGYFDCPYCQQEVDSAIFTVDAEPDEYTITYTVFGREVTEWWEGELPAECPHCEGALVAHTESFYAGHWVTEDEGNAGEFVPTDNEVGVRFEVRKDEGQVSP